MTYGFCKLCRTWQESPYDCDCRTRPCKTCDGTGHVSQCPVCDGTGEEPA